MPRTKKFTPMQKTTTTSDELKKLSDSEEGLSSNSDRDLPQLKYIDYHNEKVEAIKLSATNGSSIDQYKLAMIYLYNLKLIHPFLYDYIDELNLIRSDYLDDSEDSVKEMYSTNAQKEIYAIIKFTQQQAIYWLKQAIRNNYAPAYDLLSKLYFKGNHVIPKDDGISKKLRQKALELAKDDTVLKDMQAAVLNELSLLNGASVPAEKILEIKPQCSKIIRFTENATIIPEELNLIQKTSAQPYRSILKKLDNCSVLTWIKKSIDARSLPKEQEEGIKSDAQEAYDRAVDLHSKLQQGDVTVEQDDYYMNKQAQQSAKRWQYVTVS